MWIFNLFARLGKRIARTFTPANRRDVRIKRVVAITGCDSGLGWAIAARSAREGLVTIAGMFQGTDTKAAEALRKLCIHPYSLDVTNPESIAGFKDYVNCFLEDNPNYKLHAVVNNAGVMTIGNYEWQTPAMIENTINVNLLGAMRVASAFLPSLRRSALENTSSLKPRLINVASHCGLQPLPSFGPYCASKAGLVSWTRALRSEYRAMGLATLAFIPGGFVNSSNIMAKQNEHGKQMIENFTEEQRSFYEGQITALNNYLSLVPVDVTFNALRNEAIINTFMKALTEDDPAELYKVECWRYKIYYSLMKIPFPESVQHWLIKRFINLPNVN